MIYFIILQFKITNLGIQETCKTCQQIWRGLFYFTHLVSSNPPGRKRFLANCTGSGCFHLYSTSAVVQPSEMRRGRLLGEPNKQTLPQQSCPNYFSKDLKRRKTGNMSLMLNPTRRAVSDTKNRHRPFRGFMVQN